MARPYIGQRVGDVTGSVQPGEPHSFLFENPQVVFTSGFRTNQQINRAVRGGNETSHVYFRAGQPE